MATTKEFNKTIRHLLIGCAFFDSLGIGFETLTYDEVQNYIHKDPNWFQSIVYPTKNPYFDCSKFEPGIFTDDFQLTFAVAKSIIIYNDLNTIDIAQNHIDEYHISTNGWGSGTRASVERLINGVSITESGSKESVGNGVLMKITPLAYFLTTEPQLSIECRIFLLNEIISMTHNNNLSKILTNIHVHLLMFIFQNKSINIFEFNSQCAEIKKQLEKTFTMDEVNGIFSNTIDKINCLIKQPNVSDKDYLNISNNASFHQIDTFNLVWNLILLKGINQQLPFYALTLGGDTDTIGSILGSIVCTLMGSDWLKATNPLLYHKLKRLNEIDELTDK